MINLELIEQFHFYITMISGYANNNKEIFRFAVCFVLHLCLAGPKDPALYIGLVTESLTHSLKDSLTH